MRTIVIDASVVLKWYLKDEYSAAAARIEEEFRTKRLSLIAPSLLHAEVMNVMLMAIRSKRMTPEDARQAVLRFLTLEIEIVSTHPISSLLQTFDSAYAHQLTIYDSQYVTLAQTMHCHLYTADKKLYNKLHDAVDYIRWIEDFS